MSKRIIGLNWKMNPATISEVKELVNSYNTIIVSDSFQVMVFVPDCYLSYCVQNLNSSYLVGSQDAAQFTNNGAYTGSNSAKMLQSVGSKNTLVGHGETRKVNSLNEEVITAKIKECLDNNIEPVLCVGYGMKDSNDLETLKLQINSYLSIVDESRDVIIAFEPTASIGTGQALSTDEIDAVGKFVKSISPNIKFLYGGSVNSSNFDQITSLDTVDGILAGGISLKIDELSKILG